MQQSAFALADSCLFDCEVPLLGSQPSLDLSSSGELDDLLVVPDVECKGDLWSLDDLFTAESGEGSESAATAVLTLSHAASDASTRFGELRSSTPPLACSPSSSSSQGLSLRPPTPPQRPQLSLGLKLDLGSVAAAWGALGGGRPAIGISAEQLASIAASIPSLADRAASLSAESALPLAAGPGDASSQGTSAPPLSEEELAARKAALARFKEKKSARSSGSGKKVRYEMRRINAEKRPRIKGRFVKKSELEAYMAQQAQQEALEQYCQMVPCC